MLTMNAIKQGELDSIHPAGKSGKLHSSPLLRRHDPPSYLVFPDNVT